MLKALAILFGIVFIVIGVLGFFPDFTPHGKLFDIFSVNSMHNAVHIISGVIALLCGLSSGLAAKIYFIIFGIIYAVLAVLGFMHGDTMLLGMIANNTADSWLHAAIAILSLYFGFFLRAE